MEMLTLIVALSTIMWYIIDRFKELWGSLKYGKYITIGISAIFAFSLCFGFGLDIIFALGLVGGVSVIGTILTALCLMGGSSAISEIISRVKNGKTESTEKVEENANKDDSLGWWKGAVNNRALKFDFLNKKVYTINSK